MKERPILFSAPMVRAILDGNKTQTRRIIKPQPEEGTDCPYHVGIGNDRRSRVCPYGVPGDHLWIRETWNAFPVYEVNSGVFEAGEPYAAIPKQKPSNACVLYSVDQNDEGRWRPSIHMPHWASRITLEIVSVRVDRLQDISAEDAIAEGLTDCGGAWSIKTEEITSRCVDPRDTYRDLWEHINGTGSWAKNHWVWVIDFKLVELC